VESESKSRTSGGRSGRASLLDKYSNELLPDIGRGAAAAANEYSNDEAFRGFSHSRDQAGLASQFTLVAASVDHLAVHEKLGKASMPSPPHISLLKACSHDPGPCGGSRIPFVFLC
jgi:hypothetical protein